jgi:hypothetical protein
MSLPIVIRRDSSHTFDSATSSLVLFLHIEFGIGQKEIGGNAVLLMGGIPSLDELQSLIAGFLKSIIQLETRPRGRPLCARTCRSTAAHRLRGRIRIYANSLGYRCGVLENCICRPSAAGRITARGWNGETLPHADFRPSRAETYDMFTFRAALRSL